MRALLRGPRGWIIVGATTALVALVLVWFQPQTLLFDTVVDEQLPQSSALSGPTTQPATDGVVPPAADGDEPPPADEPNLDADTNADDDRTPAADEQPATGAPPAPGGITELASGSFGSLGRYTTVGQAVVVELDDGRRFVRLEDFETTNGPDLYVYLSTGAADGTTSFTEQFVDLGALRGNIGNQNYEIPPDVDPSSFTTVVIYCERFSSPFGAAELVSG